MTPSLHPSSGGRHVLLVAALVHVGLFVGTIYSRLSGSETFHLNQSCEGICIGSDGLGYYAWSRSLLVDGDWQFDNEFDEHNPYRHATPHARTSTGRRLNQWAVGPSVLWSITVAPAHVVLSYTNGFGVWPADGYSLPYQSLVGGTTLALAILTLYLIAGICRHFVSLVAAALAAAVITLATPLVHYGTIEPSMAHGPASAMLAGFIWFWLRDFGSSRPARWFVLGVLFGFTAATRWQLATYAILPAGELAWWAIRQRNWGRAAGCVAVAGAGIVIGFAPQLIAWKITCGQWLANPHPLARNWLLPDLSRTFLSTNRGLFYWTPATLLAFGGLVWGAIACGASGARLRLCLLLAGFVVQAYALASIHGAGIDLGAAFGHRFLTESCVPLAVGLALLFDSRSLAFRFAFGLTCGALTVWNLLLVTAYHHGILSSDAGGDPAAVVSVVDRVLSYPWRGVGWGRSQWEVFRREIFSPQTLTANAWRLLAFTAGAVVLRASVLGRPLLVEPAVERAAPAEPPALGRAA